MEKISSRLDKAENLIENINLHSVEHRLASYGSSENDKSSVCIAAKMSQETLSRKLAVFQEKGYVELEGQRKIILLNVEELKNI